MTAAVMICSSGKPIISCAGEGRICARARAMSLGKTATDGVCQPTVRGESTYMVSVRPIDAMLNVQQQ